MSRQLNEHSGTRPRRFWRRRALFVLVLVLLGIAGLVVLEKISDDRQRTATQAALPAARAFLASNPAYQNLQVDVAFAQGHGWCLWFTGSLGTEADVHRFDEELEKRYAAGDVEFTSSVLPRN